MLGNAVSDCEGTLKLAAFFPENPTAAWSLTHGLCDTLERMGHEVTRCGFSGEAIRRSAYPAVHELDRYEALIVSGPEHIGRYIHALYPEWSKVKAAKLGWLHESVKREDYGTLNVEAIKRLCDVNFCPAEQDTEYGFDYLPFGVDTEMFWAGCLCGAEPCWHTSLSDTEVDDGACEPVEDSARCSYLRRTIDLGFIGMVYQKRQKFLSELAPRLEKAGLHLRIGKCVVEDLDGVNLRRSAELYAENLRRIKVFLSLPSLSRLKVTKITEAQACGCDVFECKDGEADAAAKFAIERLSDSAKREQSAREQCEDVHENHRLDQRLATMLAKASVAA